MDTQADSINIGFSKAFELALNTAIHLDEQQGAAFDALDGKVIELWIAPLKKPLFCLINQRRVATQGTLSGQADVTLKTGMRQLRTLAQGGEFEARFIRGDENTGNHFIGAMEQMEIDWEEHLSHYTGDLLAFKIGHGLRQARQQQQQVKSAMKDTLREYLQFEINALPTSHQVSHFMDEVEQTRREVDELAQRIAKLKPAQSADC